jgi:hypothetical protein
MTSRESLAYQLKIQFELPPDRPTNVELDLILTDVAAFERARGRAPTKEEWRAITRARVRFTGSHFYKGLNFQDLNALLTMIRLQAQPARK